jgi:hypothetical protein
MRELRGFLLALLCWAAVGEAVGQVVTYSLGSGAFTSIIQQTSNDILVQGNITAGTSSRSGDLHLINSSANAERISITPSGNTITQTSISSYGWTSGSTSTATQDTFLTRGGAAATIQIGNVAAASPAAQTLQSQGSRVGTDVNIAGGNLSVQPGVGTGNSTPSDMIFNTWVAVSTGSATQTKTNTLHMTAGNIFMPALPTTPGSKQPLCVDTSTHQLYAGSAGAC